MASNKEISRITEILWNQMKINDEADKKTSTLTSSRGTAAVSNNVVQQFSTIATMAANKKKSSGTSRSNRDSLAFRESPGRPGTKRFNRYLNTQFLKTAGSLDNGSTSNAEMDYTFSEHRNTLFYQDQQNLKHYSEYHVNISCDQEQDILNSVSSSYNLQHVNNHNCDDDHYSKLKKNLRPFFKKSFLMENQFILDAEQEILAFLSTGNCNTKEYQQDNPSKRLIIHGLASYYSLMSKSHTTKSGQRILVLKKQRNMPDLPELSITQYLSSESKKQATQQKQQHLVQRKKVIKKSSSIYIKKRILSTSTTSNNTTSTSTTTTSTTVEI